MIRLLFTEHFQEAAFDGEQPRVHLFGCIASSSQVVGCQPMGEVAGSEGFLVALRPQKMSNVPGQSTALDSSLFLLSEKKTIRMLIRQHNTCYLGWEGRRGEWDTGSRGQIKLWLLQGKTFRVS